MSELNREQIISEIDEKIRYAKFINTDAVILSRKAAQFCLEHVQFYEQKIKELTEENERLRAENEIKSQKRANIFEIANAFERGRTDGVQKMQTEIEKRCIEGGIYPAFIKSTIDQIAKEMMEEEK